MWLLACLIVGCLFLAGILILQWRNFRASKSVRRLPASDPRPLQEVAPIQLVSIIMPALDEEVNIIGAVRNVLGAFDDLHIAGEIVVVNDGSTDRTPKLVLEEMGRDARVRLINHETPAGIGAAFWDGVAAARGEVVCMLPGDNENDPWEILRYHQLMQHVDILIPFAFNKEVRSLYRNALSYIFRFIINTTFFVNFNYTNGTVMYRKKILEELDFHSLGFFYQTDILVRTVKRGYLFAEVPYRLDVRPHGISKAVSFPSLWRVMKGYSRLVRDMHLHGQGRAPAEFAAGSQAALRHGAPPPSKPRTSDSL